MIRTGPAVSTALLAALLGLRTAAPPEKAAGPSLTEDDRLRVGEAFRLAERIGDQIWPGWAGVPFALVPRRPCSSTASGPAGKTSTSPTR